MTTHTTTNEESTMRDHDTRRVAARYAGKLLAALVATFMPLISPGTAAAGEYQQHFCQSGPSPFHANAWYGQGQYVSDRCLAGAAFPDNSVYFNTATLALNQYGALRADAPPGARYKSIESNLRVPYQSVNRRTYVLANQQYVLNWHNGHGGTSSFNPDGNFFPVLLNNSPYFEVGQACHAAPAAGCESGDFVFTGLKATLEDTKAPTVNAHTDRGLFDAGRTFFRGVVPVVADVTDDGHGPYVGSVRVDGSEAAGTYVTWGDSCNYRLANPCPPRIGWTSNVNTAAYPDGTHVIRVIGGDGMGQVTYGDRAVTFDNTAPVMGAVDSVDGTTSSADSTVVTASATDATSGVDRIDASIDGGTWQAAGEVTVAGAGAHQVRFRAVDRAGNTSAVQTVTFTLQAPPSNHGLTTTNGQPLPGAPGPGDTVRCDVGSPWSEGTRFSFQWLRDGAAISGAVDQTYTLVAADAGKVLTCRLTATNAAGDTVRVTPDVTAGSQPCFGKVAPTDPCGDFDGDGVPNQDDADDDNDGVLDGSDPSPFNPNVPGSPSNTTTSSATNTTTTNNHSTSTGKEAGVYVGPPNNGVNASDKAVIRIRGKRKRTVKFGRRIRTVAHLRDEHNRPITGAAVHVLERSKLPGATWVPARAPLVSDSRGRLRWLIPAKHSRTIRYAYKANLANTEFQSTSDVVLKVFSKSTFGTSRRVAHNGQTIAFLGRVLSRPIPRGGVLIDIQAKVGRRWQTFKTARTRPNGRWKATYRFRATRGVQVYSFRARVRQDTGYPYALSSTRPVKVKVIG